MSGLAEIGETVIIHKDRYTYDLGPSIIILDNGEWLAGFNQSRRRERIMHPPSDPLYRNYLTRSSDQGKTWGEPYTPDYSWSGQEHPCLEQLSDGTVVLTHFRFGWYPLELAKKRRAAGEPISLNLLAKRGAGAWTEDFTDDDWEKSKLPWARGYHGLYAHLSNDRGYTFDTVKIDCSPHRDGYTRTGVTELQDGRIAYVVCEHHGPFYPPRKGKTFILFSTDSGKSWSAPHVIAEGAGSEPDIIEVSPGEIYCIIRNRSGYLHGFRSLDGGDTWSLPEATPMDMGERRNPGHLLLLKDGRLFCSYGRRSAPFGIYGCISEDGGRTWNIEQEIVIRNDLPNWDLGYPTTIEYEPGRLFVCYWGEEPDEVSCIQGTYVNLT